MPVASVDTETFWSKAEGISITTQGWWHYLHGPKFECYLVSIATDTGLVWVGDPKDAPWEQISGPDWTWITPNAAFDEAVFEMLRDELGVIPKHIKPGVWECVCDLLAYLGYPRSLANGCKYILGLTLDKSPRDKMSGVRWRDVSPEQRQEMIEYAREDAIRPLQIWQKVAHMWPIWERRVSRLTRAQVKRGMRVDVPRVRNDIQRLKRLVWLADQKIPWANEAAALSYPRLCAECRKEGILPPPSLDQRSEECAAWEEQYGDRFPWVDAMRVKRKAGTFLSKLETLLRMVRPDGRASLPIKYCGASTRRTSGGYSEKGAAGDKSYNPQNLARESMLGAEMVRYGIEPVVAFTLADVTEFDAEGNPVTREQTVEEGFQDACKALGVNMRECLIADDGKVLTPCDLSNIEPRVIHLIAGDTEMIGLIKSGVEIYEAHARQTMGYDRPEPLKTAAKKSAKFDTMRRLAKARCVSRSTLVLTEKGYVPAHKVTKLGCVSMWDGEQWVAHDGTSHNGHRTTSELFGEHLTADHLVFVSPARTQPAGSISERNETRTGRQTLYWRPTPGSDWSDVWKLARGVGRNVSQEGLSLCRGYLRLLRRKLRRFLAQHKAGSHDAVLQVCLDCGAGHKSNGTVGAAHRQSGLHSRRTVATNHGEVL